MGSAMAAKARVQINLAVSQVVDIKQVATFPDIMFPIIWFEEVGKNNIYLKNLYNYGVTICVVCFVCSSIISLKW